MGFFSDLFKSKKNTTTQEAMLTDQQKGAQDLLYDFAKSGRFGDYTAGADGGALGYYTPTGIESDSLTKLYQLINSGSPEALGTAKDALTGLATNEFKLDDPSNGYAAFSRMAKKALGDQNDMLNREAAITGDRFSTSIGKEKAGLQEETNDILMSKVAELFNLGENRKLSASQALTSLAGVEEGINTNRINLGASIGALERQLKDQQAKDKYQDFLRKQNEKLGQIGVTQGLFNKNVPYGIKSITKESPSTFMSMFGEVNPVVGSYNTHKYGYNTNQSSLSDLMKLVASMQTGGQGGSFLG